MSKEIVAVAMSGGVDSSTAAALLVEQGFEVIGITMCLLNKYDDRSYGSCCSIEAIEDARRVADRLNIRHVVLPMQDAFKRFVIEDFINQYRNGKTPNPCIRCNQFIKFDMLLRHAEAVGAKKLATGHYARISKDPETGRYLLLRGHDKRKDQSYALFRLTQEQLSKALFPLGNMTKKETREYASAIGLPVAERRESQEICFVSDKDYQSFLIKVAPELSNPGRIIDTHGKNVGTHKGIAFYTIGQRKRLGVYGPKPSYVVRIDKDANTIVIGSEEDLYSSRLLADEINLISIEKLTGELAVTAKIRYNALDSRAVVRKFNENMIEVLFEKPQRAITPGQAVVLYDGERVVGGGTIVSSG